MASARTAAGSRSQRSRRAPARKSKGPGGIRWDRVARISLLVVLVLILASYVGPAASYIKAWNLSNETHAELSQLQQQNKQLRKRAKQLRSPAAVELEARKIGMANTGEKLYVIKDERRP